MIKKENLFDIIVDKESSLLRKHKDKKLKICFVCFFIKVRPLRRQRSRKMDVNTNV